MATVTGFTNSFTSGEIFEDASDRTDIQPVAKGFKTGQNLIVQTVGPLKKRRGFWYLARYGAGTTGVRCVPFRRSVNDALMLVLSPYLCSVYLSNGSPYIYPTTAVQFATDWNAAAIAKLRYKQVGDVIYFTASDGSMAPVALVRTTDASWGFITLGFPNGPWLPENINTAISVAVTGTSITDATTTTSPQAKAVNVGQSVTLTATGGNPWVNTSVGDTVRLRQSTGSPGVLSWEPGFNSPVGTFRLSVGNVYVSTYDAGGGNKQNATTPPVQTIGAQSDGCSTFNYLHDGAGIVQVTNAYAGNQVIGNVLAAIPMGNADTTTYWSNAAYSNANGWPRAWPSAVEERLVMGATTHNLDMIDLTRTAGFSPNSADFHPGQGTGNVVATDAMRRRLGDDGGEILWTRQSTFLIAGTSSAEYVISGGLFGDPLSPSTIIVRQISQYGSADVYPAKLEKGLAYVARGGQTVREIRLDLQQNDSGADVSFLAHHIELRGFSQLCWIPAPDRGLWARLADGGAAVLTMHDEQQVRGWTTQALGVPAAGAAKVTDVVSLPGPGGYETLWLVCNVTLGGANYDVVMMQSQVSDGLFMDFASKYAGAPVSTIGGLSYLNGETVRVLANGVQIVDQVVSGGTITVPAGTTTALVGLKMEVRFDSLKLDLGAASADLLNRQRLAGCTVDLLATVCTVGLTNGATNEISSSRQVGDALTGPVARRYIDRVTIAGDVSTDPRITITEDTAYDFGVFALRPTIVNGG
jgi:hypothetical protein